MASHETKSNVCLMCLDAPAVKKLGSCEHSYCMPCLHAHIEEQMKGKNEVISCPACQGQSQPDNLKVGKDERNVPGAIEEDGGQDVLSRGHGLQQATAAIPKKEALRQANCKLCHFKGETVKAVNECKECKKVPLCKDCSTAHCLNEATKKHVVTSIALLRDEDPCTIHDELLELFCITCSKNVCHICVLLDHVGHTTESFNNVVFTEVEKVRSALENEERWLEMLKSNEKELKKSKETAQEMEDVLIKSIEDHAEKCIEEILKNKEALKKQVKTDFEVVRVMEKRLEAMPTLQRTSADIAAAANQLLNEQAELHSTYVENLVGMKQQLARLKEGHPSYGEDRERYRKAYKDVCRKAMKFYPRTPNCKIGGFKDPGPRCNAGGPCVCETCEQKADPARVVECRQKGSCTCGTCAKVSKWPNENREGECRREGACTCGTCTKETKWPDVSRVDECRQKGSCTCGVCTKVSKWPNEKRVFECRQTGTCKCGRCGCVYYRKMLFRNGDCSYCGKRKMTLTDNQTFP